MDWLSTFLNGFFDFLKTLPQWQGIFLLVIFLLILIFEKNIKVFLNYVCQKMFSQRRSCSDCILIIFGISAKYKTEIEILEKNILKEQMNYVEQKIETLFLDLIRTYKEDQLKKLKEQSNYSLDLVDKEYIIYQEVLSNSIEVAKREVRRSFKENGFHIKSGKEFADYVKGKTKDVLAIARKHMINKYPKNALILIEERFSSFDEKDFEDLMFDVYIKAKEIRIETENKIKELEIKFKEEIDRLIKR